METLEEIRQQIMKEFTWLHCEVDKDLIVVEEDYEMGEDEKNSDDCVDVARENGEMIIEKFPMLEIDEYLCHRNKYSIVMLKIKTTSSQP